MTDKINEKLGAWLLKDGNTRDALSKKLNISRPALQNRLNGTSKWYWHEIVKVAEITGSTLDELAGK